LRLFDHLGIGLPIFPHPCAQAKRRGPRSRAGLIAYPALTPKEIPIATTIRPTMNGAMFALAGELYSSITAKTQATSSAVPIT
jgi:hypothetical protein